MGGVEAFIRSSIEYGTPLLLAAAGEIYAERAGVLNLGIEGLMAVGAVVAFIVSTATGNPWAGVVAAAATAAALSLVHALFSITLRANQIVSGLALAIMGLGLSSLLGASYVGYMGVPITSVVKIPLISRIPVISALSGLDPLSYIALALSVLMWYILFKTRVGLVIRAVGEDPSVAESMGHNVHMVRYAAVIVGGALAGIAGSYLSLVINPGWFEGMTAGRGWIALGIVILASWSPLRAIIASYLIGSLIQLRFLLAPYLGVSGTLLDGLPYLMVVIMLSALSIESVKRKLGAPASLGKPYPA